MSIIIEMITPTELAEIMNWSIKTARDVFSLPDFPSCDFGKEQKAELEAVKEYFSKPRRKETYFC